MVYDRRSPERHAKASASTSQALDGKIAMGRQNSGRVVYLVLATALRKPLQAPVAAEQNSAALYLSSPGLVSLWLRRQTDASLSTLSRILHGGSPPTDRHCPRSRMRRRFFHQTFPRLTMRPDRRD